MMRALPEVGGTRVVSMRMSVDLPAPFGPRSPKTSPRATVKLRLSTATKSPNDLEISSTSTALPGLEIPMDAEPAINYLNGRMT